MDFHVIVFLSLSFLYLLHTVLDTGWLWLTGAQMLKNSHNKARPPAFIADTKILILELTNLSQQIHTSVSDVQQGCGCALPWYLVLNCASCVSLFAKIHFFLLLKNTPFSENYNFSSEKYTLEIKVSKLLETPILWKSESKVWSPTNQSTHRGRR